ncbi:MAG TPA: hypothetical protein VI636_15385 [Candidatus Angelobacter sp.]
MREQLAKNLTTGDTDTADRHRAASRSVQGNRMKTFLPPKLELSDKLHGNFGSDGIRDQVGSLLRQS